MSSSWSTAVADWQGVDDEPTVGSKNLVESWGIKNAIYKSECINTLIPDTNITFIYITQLSQDNMCLQPVIVPLTPIAFTMIE